MPREEGLPGRLRAALRYRLDAMVLEDRLNRVAGDVVADALQPAADPRVPPGWVLGRHAHDERRDIWLGARATKAVSPSSRRISGRQGGDTTAGWCPVSRCRRRLQDGAGRGPCLSPPGGGAGRR